MHGPHAQVVIRFTPDSLADYTDEVVVDTALARFAVPLRAHRPPPLLTLLQVGHRALMEASSLYKQAIVW